MYRIARQTTDLQDGVRLLGGVLNVLGVCRIARDSAKVEDQVRSLARTLNNLALEPDGTATGCNPVQVGSTPTGVSLEAMIRPGQRRTVPCPHVRQLAPCVP